VVLLHDAPGTGLGVREVAAGLGERFEVLVPDQPGCGLTALPAGGDVLEAAAWNVLAVADAVGAERFGLAAVGCGVAVAARLARVAPGRVSHMVVGALARADAELVAPEIALSPVGAHWVQAWLMLRDGQIYAPWYDGSVAAQRRTQGNFDAAWLHEQTVALMEGRATYQHYPRAAALEPGAEILDLFPGAVALPGESFTAGVLAGLF